MAFHICAPENTGKAANRRGLIIGKVVVVHDLVVPGVGFQILITIGQIPRAFPAGFAERNAAPITLVALTGCGRVVHEFAGDFDWKRSFIKRETVQLVSRAAAGDDGIIAVSYTHL